MCKKEKIIFSICLMLVGASCAPTPSLQPEYMSLMDVKYRLNMLKTSSRDNPEDNKNVEVGSVSFYQAFLSPILNSTCHHYPTDSRYARVLFSKCSWPVSVVKTASRYFSEPDAAMLYTHQTIENNRLYYVDLPEGCSL